MISPAILLVILMGTGKAAEEDRHPVIGDKPARELLNSDLLALPDRERQAWVHGAVTMMAQTVSMKDRGVAGCLGNWFTGESVGQIRLTEVMKEYPEQPATSTVYAVARLGCEGL